MIRLLLNFCLFGISISTTPFNINFKCRPSRAKIVHKRYDQRFYPQRLVQGQVVCQKQKSIGYSIYQYRCVNVGEFDNFEIRAQWADRFSNCIIQRTDAPQCSIRVSMAEQTSKYNGKNVRPTDEPLKLVITLESQTSTIKATKTLTAFQEEVEIPVFCNARGRNTFDSVTIEFENTIDETNRIEIESIKLYESYRFSPVSEFVYGLPVPFENAITIPETSYRQIAHGGNDAEFEELNNYQWNTGLPEGITEDYRRLYILLQNSNADFTGMPREFFWSAQRDENFLTCFALGDWTTLNENNKLISQTETAKTEDDYLKTPHFKNRGWMDEFEDRDTFVVRTLNGYRTKGLKMLTKDSEIFEFIQFRQYRSWYTPKYVARKMTHSKLFYVDVSAFGELSDYTGTAPILLLELRHGQLQPLFIQTSRLPDSYIFTPRDKMVWKLGMRVFEGANMLLQTVSEHLFESHIITEAFAISTYKSLPVNHPVYKILYPHMKGVLTINAYARMSKEGGGGLIGQGGFIQRATELSYENQYEYFDSKIANWDLDEINLPVYLEKYGLTEDKLPVPFVLRDDGMKYWNLISSYVSSVIDHSFSDDNSVKSDTYISEFIAQMKYGMEQAPKIQQWFSENHPENSKDELVKLLTIIIWQATVGHNMEHYPIWDFGGNPNIAPWKLEKPLPVEKPTSMSDAEYKSYLPTPESFKDQMNLAFASTEPKGETEYLKDFSDIYVNSYLRKFAYDFRSGVKSLENQITADHEDKNYPIPYDYLLANQLTARIDN